MSEDAMNDKPKLPAIIEMRAVVTSRPAWKIPYFPDLADFEPHPELSDEEAVLELGKADAPARRALTFECERLRACDESRRDVQVRNSERVMAPYIARGQIHPQAVDLSLARAANRTRDGVDTDVDPEDRLIFHPDDHVGRAKQFLAEFDPQGQLWFHAKNFGIGSERLTPDEVGSIGACFLETTSVLAYDKGGNLVGGPAQNDGRAEREFVRALRILCRKPRDWLPPTPEAEGHIGISSPVGRFVDECLEIEPGARCSTDAVRAAYRNWCAEKGVDAGPDDRMQFDTWFGKQLRSVTRRAVRRDSVRTRYKDENGKPKRRQYYLGARLR